MSSLGRDVVKIEEDVCVRPLISIVIPVYNVEAYLEQCVESVRSQSYENLEIILVDDGSTDGSGVLCDGLAKADTRIRVIHKDNGGLSDARNHGVLASTGEYISFIDSDDYVSSAFISALYGAIDKCGTRIAAVPGGTYFHDGDNVCLETNLECLLKQKTTKIDKSDYLKDMLYQKLTTGAPWRLYARDIVEAHPFPVGLLYEDLATTYKFVKESDSVALIDSIGLYAYRLRESGIIRRNYTRDKSSSAIKVSRCVYSDIVSWFPSLGLPAASRCFSVNRMVLAQVPSDQVEDRDEIWVEIKKYRGMVLRDKNARKRERLAAAISYLGERTFFVFCKLCRALGLLR